MLEICTAGCGKGKEKGHVEGESARRMKLRGTGSLGTQARLHVKVLYSTEGGGSSFTDWSDLTQGDKRVQRSWPRITVDLDRNLELLNYRVLMDIDP